MNEELINTLVDVPNKFGVSVEKLADNLKLFLDAMLKVMAQEMIECGYCTLPNGKKLYLEDAGERFLEIYNELLS